MGIFRSPRLSTGSIESVTVGRLQLNLVGSLPSETGNDRSINLSNDQFTGSIPTELATIVNLEDFLVVGNQLIAYHRKDLLVFLFGRLQWG
jgi:hypothetical protein